MILVGLTGGIGSGKSTVAAMLAARGAVVVDADAITRKLQEPGQPVLAAMVKRFGGKIVNDDGTLDRQAMADIIFRDQKAKGHLEGIVHPAVQEEVTKEVLSHMGTDQIVIYDIPLLAEVGAKAGPAKRRPGPVIGGPPYAAIVVVDTDPDVAVARLVEQRGMNEADVRARIASQASRDDRSALADRVIHNAGSVDDLTDQVDELWTWLEELAQQHAAGGESTVTKRREWAKGARLD